MLYTITFLPKMLSVFESVSTSSAFDRMWGRGLEDVFHQYDKHVKPGYQKYIGPSISNADIVIPRGRDNLGTVRKRQVPVINGPLTISFGDQYHLNGTVKVKTKTGNIKNKLENIANHVDLDMFPTINFVNSLETRELY